MQPPKEKKGLSRSCPAAPSPPPHPSTPLALPGLTGWGLTGGGSPPPPHSSRPPKTGPEITADTCQAPQPQGQRPDSSKLLWTTEARRVRNARSTSQLRRAGRQTTGVRTPNEQRSHVPGCGPRSSFLITAFICFIYAVCRGSSSARATAWVALPRRGQ